MKIGIENEVLDRLNISIEKWKLQNVEQIEYRSPNSMFSCVSQLYGKCVLKISKFSTDIENEANALFLFQNERRNRSNNDSNKNYSADYCKIFEYDMKNRAILLKHVLPGISLREVENIDERLKIFCNVWQEIHELKIYEQKNHVQELSSNKEQLINHKTVNESQNGSVSLKSGFVMYQDWINRIAEYMSHRLEYGELSKYMTEAAKICSVISAKYKEKYLLHGDLHHDNILLGENGKYIVIDPKGVVENKIFDIPRFILNEFGDKPSDEFKDQYKYVVHFISQNLGLDYKEILQLVYMETCLANCWNVEDNEEPNMKWVLFTRNLME